MESERVEHVARNVLYVRSFHFLIGAEGDFHAFGFRDGNQGGLTRYGGAHVPE
jgi:hypothetical protein